MAITDWLPDPNRRQRGFPAPPTPTPQPSGKISDEDFQDILRKAGLAAPPSTPIPTPPPPTTPTPQPSGKISEEEFQDILRKAGLSTPPKAPVTARPTRGAVPTAMPQPVLPPGPPVSRQGFPRSAGQPLAFPSRQSPGEWLKDEWLDVITPAEPGSAMDKPGLRQLEQIWDLVDAGIIMPIEALALEPMAQAGQAAPGAEGYAGRAQAFRERPASEQIAYGLLDPSIALGSIGAGARAARAGGPSVIKNFRTWQQQIREAAVAKRAMEESGRIGSLFNRPATRGRPLAGLVEAEQATPRMGDPTTRPDRMLPAPAARAQAGVPVEEGRVSGVDQFGNPIRMESPVPAQESIQKIVISRNNPKGEIVTFRSNNAVQTALRQGDDANNIILDLGASSEEINSARQTLAAGERGSTTLDISRADTEIRDNLAELRTLRGRSRTQGRSTDPSELRRDLLLDRNEHLQSQITRANARAMDIEPDTIQDIGPSREILQEEIEQSRNLFDQEYGTLDIDDRKILRQSLPPDIQARIRRLREEDELSRLRPPDVEPGAIDDAENILDVLRPGDIISREPLQELAYITRARGADDPILGTVLGPTSEVPRAPTLTEGRTTDIQLPGTGRQIEARTPREADLLRQEVRREADRVASGDPDVVLNQQKRQVVDESAPDPKTSQGPNSSPVEPSDFLRRAQEGRLLDETIDQRLLINHESAITTAQRETREIVRQGNNALLKAGLGTRLRGGVTAGPDDIADFDELNRLLHNPSKVASGELVVPPRFKPIYDEIRALTDLEETARVDFEPGFATMTDYLYRGWKAPEGMFSGARTGANIGGNPGFKKPRVGATYDEMREAGFEPLHWNPYEQWRISRLLGIRYRQQTQLIEALKHSGDEVIQEVPSYGSVIPEGWRVPELGQAFEGKAFAMTHPDGQTGIGYRRRFMVPNQLADRLETMYGKPPDLGSWEMPKLFGGRTVDNQKLIDSIVFIPKRAKLIGSFFQTVDFLARGGVGSGHAMLNALASGHPIEAVQHMARYPGTVKDIVGSYFLPKWQRNLAKELTSTTPLLKGRPGVHMKGIVDAGLSIADVTIVPNNIDEIARQVAQETGTMKKLKSVPRAIGTLERASRQGLFQGTYPAAIINDTKKNVARTQARTYPEMTDAQLNSAIAKAVNKKYSTIPASQSMIQGFWRNVFTRVFFSMGESEGLLRQFAGTIPFKVTKDGKRIRLASRPGSRYWIEHWLGAYVFFIGTAAATHFAFTGKMLPMDRFSPIEEDPYGMLPVGYNTKFAAPTLPVKGRGGVEQTLDLVGQMDTAFRVLNPPDFITARQSVPIAAISHQLEGESFQEEPLDSGTKRLIQGGLDVFAPIGATNIVDPLREQLPESLQYEVPQQEPRLGGMGRAIQTLGINVRAETTPDLLNPTSQAIFGEDYYDLEDDEKTRVRNSLPPDIQEELRRRREESNLKRFGRPDQTESSTTPSQYSPKLIY